MEFIGVGINHLFAKSGAKIMDAKAFHQPLQMLCDMSNALLMNNDERFDVFMSMLKNLYEVRMEAFSACRTQEDVETFHASILRDSSNTDLMAAAIATHAMQFLGDYSEIGADNPKFCAMCELVHRIGKIGTPVSSSM
jgi:hypothetical protein